MRSPSQPGTQSHPGLQALVFYSYQVAESPGWVGSVMTGMGAGWGEPLANSHSDGCSSAVAIVTGALRRNEQVLLRLTTPNLPSEGRGLWACGGYLPLAPQYHHQHRGRPHTMGERQCTSAAGPV